MLPRLYSITKISLEMRYISVLLQKGMCPWKAFLLQQQSCLSTELHRCDDAQEAKYGIFCQNFPKHNNLVMCKKNHVFFFLHVQNNNKWHLHTFHTTLTFNTFPHWKQLKRFYLLWTNICLVRFDLYLNLLPHSEQLKDFAFAWTTIWATRFAL